MNILDKILGVKKRELDNEYIINKLHLPVGTIGTLCICDIIRARIKDPKVKQYMINRDLQYDYDLTSVQLERNIRYSKELSIKSLNKHENNLVNFPCDGAGISNTMYTVICAFLLSECETRDTLTYLETEHIKSYFPVYRIKGTNKYINPKQYNNVTIDNEVLISDGIIHYTIATTLSLTLKTRR